ncbi:hypothetical protein EDD86DRAFT_63204 [Gorgonomyces haynaldii]|nr:hypothetical protein EDD86DRAFT_63204 [Gorgonomyces haynaldii]
MGCVSTDFTTGWSFIDPIQYVAVVLVVTFVIANLYLSFNILWGNMSKYAFANSLLTLNSIQLLSLSAFFAEPLAEFQFQCAEIPLTIYNFLNQILLLLIPLFELEYFKVFSGLTRNFTPKVIYKIQIFTVLLYFGLVGPSLYILFKRRIDRAPLTRINNLGEQVFQLTIVALFAQFFVCGTHVHVRDCPVLLPCSVDIP